MAKSSNDCDASLLVFADDWGRHPSSCQHLVRHLLDRCQVTWVNTIGTRTPRLDMATLKRGMEKLGHWFTRQKSTIPLPANLAVINPRMWPWFGSTWGRKLNRRLLVRHLTPIIQSMPQPVVAVTTIPVVSDLIAVLPVVRWVYYCVDDFGLWPGLDSRTLESMETCLIAGADTLVAASDTLREKLATHGRSAHLLTHGVELDFWAAPTNNSACTELDSLERPLVVFWGVVDRRMDVGFVQCLAADMQRGTIVMVGPEADPDPALHRIPRMRRLGPVTFERLPCIAQQAAVLIMPYADLPVTRAMQPLKLKEYLATGKPTVVRDLPANRDWADCLDLAATPEVFSQAVRQRLESGLPRDQQHARTRLAAESWTEKARAFAEWTLSPQSSSVGA
ncbi:MAG TPA: hypothetical protein VE988_20625 [Gemmataceae bacterium]|nr:hypothetical protein [Gemmataceae bacterium]